MKLKNIFILIGILSSQLVIADSILEIDYVNKETKNLEFNRTNPTVIYKTSTMLNDLPAIEALIEEHDENNYVVKLSILTSKFEHVSLGGNELNVPFEYSQTILTKNLKLAVNETTTLYAVDEKPILVLKRVK